MWVNVRGGLGNQMFQAAKGIALGKIYGVKPLFLDLTEGDDFGRKWELDVFGLSPSCPTPAEKWLLDARMRIAKKARRFGRFYTVGVLNEAPLATGQVPPTRVPVLVNGFWQQPAHFSGDLELPVRQTFRFPAHPTIEDFAADPSPVARVAIHVRRGDFVSHAAASKRHLVCDVDWYRRAWNQMRRMLGACQGFVFSDEPQWVREVLGLTGEVHVMTGSADLPSWIDMARMSLCDHFIISNSSYSWWAAFLSEAANKQVIAPEYWFTGTRSSDIGICPLEWRLL